MSTFQNIHKSATLASAAASLAVLAMLVRKFAKDFFSSSQLIVVIEEFQGISKDKLFEAVDIYLGSKMASSVRKVKALKERREKKMEVSISSNDEMIDIFENVQVKWTLVWKNGGSLAFQNGMILDGMTLRLPSEIRSYELSFDKVHKDLVLNSYLPSILQRSKAIKEENKALKLHTVRSRIWQQDVINVDHPMTFQTLAMDSELKRTILEDLDNFINGKEYYRRTGKAWKRGYLLYGPPGTGKSSFIAAMANHLSYDIYDLNLNAIYNTSDLKVLLLSISTKSIIVMEDIDCMFDVQNHESDHSWAPRRNQITLSGLLNFIDGLWSFCGDQGRIMVVTTNKRELLDPALLRPGRMDMHIHMSYCNVSAFKQLVLNCLGVCQHPLCEEIEGLIGEIEVTPAEVSGELMKSKDPEISLRGLAKFLRNKIEEDKRKSC